jgi:hypothetical protein
MGKRPIVWVLGLVFGCAEPVEDDEYAACVSLCDELVETCSYSAYPTTESCMAGCAEQVEDEVELFELEACILDAECDTFAIIECQNQFGVES